MDLLWTLLLLGIGYFVYTWYTRLQREAKNERDPKTRIEGQPPMDEPAARSGAATRNDYIDYEEVDD